MKKAISKKMTWVATSAWRGYEQPINAVGGANDTGGWSDSPCPTDRCSRELDQFKKMLRAEGIPYVEAAGHSSNVFCIHRYVLVHPDDGERARQLARELEKTTLLFYAVEKTESCTP